MAQNNDDGSGGKLTEAQVMEALGSMGMDIETITRLTVYLTAPGLEPADPAEIRKVRSIILTRLAKTADALKTADAEGKL